MQDSKKIERLKRAIDEKNMKVIDLSSDNNLLSYKVLGNRGVHYKVKLELNKNISCACIDQKKNKSFCKHIYLIYVKILNILPTPDLSTHIDQDIFNDIVNRHNNFINKRNNLINQPNIILRNSEDEECSICFEIYSNKPDNPDTYCCKTCRNGFHMICINEMIKYSSSKCPMCRTNIKFNNINDIDIENDETVKQLSEQIKRL